jgi:hypothetical protein
MLIDCPDCGTSVSDKADSCKQCGYSFAVDRAKSSAKKSAIGCLVMLLLLPVGISICEYKNAEFCRKDCLRINKEYGGGKYGRNLCEIDECAVTIAANETGARGVVNSTGNLSGVWVVLVAKAEESHPDKCKAK